MTTSAYNLGKSGLVSKVLRIMDLVRAAAVARSSLGGVGTGCWRHGGSFGRAGLEVRSELLGGLLGMSQFGLWRFLSQGWMNRCGLWKRARSKLR
jgi:hypothetical protein